MSYQLSPYARAVQLKMDEQLSYYSRRFVVHMLGDGERAHREFEQQYAYSVETDPGDISGPRAPFEYGAAVASDDDYCGCHDDE